MTGGRLFTFVYALCQWICYFFYLNVMWVACTLLGGIIFGIAPSTAALFSVARKTACGEEDIPVFRTFWNVYKEEFVKANGLGAFLAGAGLVLYVNLNVVRVFDGVMYVSFNIIMSVAAIVFIFMLVYIFPVYVHFDMRFSQYIKYSISLSILNVPHVVVMLITFVSAYYFFITFPGFIPIFGVSLFAQLNMWMVFQTFKKLERKHHRLQSQPA